MRVLPVIGIVLLGTVAGWAQLDIMALNEAYKAFDLERNQGIGHSDKPDSGTLGWGEGAIIQDYADLWEVTGDPYWLSKIRDHFQRIMANATDPDGDGFLSWQTTTYSTAVAYAERLLNVSDAQIEPAFQRNSRSGEFEQATGHVYLIDFLTSADRFRIVDWDTRAVLADDIAYESGAPITAIAPFRLTITGATHQGDRFLVRTIAPEPIEFTVHQGMFIYPVALFIEAVKRDPALQAEFGAAADEFLAFINRHVFEKNERDWLELGEAGGAYRFEPKITDRFPNRVMPHNQYGALARAWLVLANVEGAHPLMADRAEKMVRCFRNALILDEEHDAWAWHYWDWVAFGEPGSSGWEDTSHGHLDVSLAVEAARRGVVFTDEDLRRMANTWLVVMWNGDTEKPLMAARVAENTDYKQSPVTRDWVLLSQWDRRAYDLALGAWQAAGGPAASAPVVLLSGRRAGAL